MPSSPLQKQRVFFAEESTVREAPQWYSRRTNSHSQTPEDVKTKEYIISLQ